MDYENELERINNTYYNVIKDRYSKYIKNFDKIPDMTKNIKIVEKFEKNDYGFCDASTGEIYICKSKFNDLLLVHEYFHRLSRNFKYKGWKLFSIPKWGWIIGMEYSKGGIDYRGFNETLTEWLASKITKMVDCKHIYHKYSYIIDELYKSSEYDFDNILMGYFNSNENLIEKELWKMYGSELFYRLNEMSQELHFS